LLACNVQSWAAESDIAPTGTLRAVYIGSNMAQAVQDRTTVPYAAPRPMSLANSGGAWACRQ
jgi:hypothetical protein